MKTCLRENFQEKMPKTSVGTSFLKHDKKHSRDCLCILCHGLREVVRYDCQSHETKTEDARKDHEEGSVALREHGDLVVRGKELAVDRLGVGRVRVGRCVPSRGETVCDGTFPPTWN